MRRFSRRSIKKTTGDFPKPKDNPGKMSWAMSLDNTALLVSKSVSRSKIPPETSSLYSQLSLEEKIMLIINDGIQWEKLQRSLRESAHVVTTGAVKQVINSYVQERIDEMEMFQTASDENRIGRRESLRSMESFTTKKDDNAEDA